MNNSFDRLENPVWTGQTLVTATEKVQEASKFPDAESCAVRLDELVTKCVSFLLGQLQQLDEAYAEFNESQDSLGGTERCEDDLSEQQAAWEEKQAEEAKRINEQLDYLTQAWSQLELEQRRQLTEGRSDSPSTFPEQEIPEHLGLSEAAPVDLIDAPCDLNSSAAEIQFQKLKREIRQHARRTR